MSHPTPRTRERYDYVVVGAGPIGSSAAKYLAGAGHTVALLAPPNDDSKAGRANSHTDHSRIARRVDSDPLWSSLASRSIGRYRGLEESTGIDFFSEVGSLLVLEPDVATELDRLVVPEGSRRLGPAELRREFEYLNFPPGSVGVLEPVSAGFIDPQRFVAAQIAAGQAVGSLDMLPLAMAAVTEVGGDAVLELCNGATVRGGDLLLAMGAYSRFEPICAIADRLTVYGRTVAHIEVPKTQADELAQMPTFRARGPQHGFYLVPPTRYPDGGWYLKIGGGPRTERLNSAGDIDQWCAGKGDTDVVELLVSKAMALISGLAPLSVRPQTCIITVPDGGRPYVGRVSTGFGVATGGNGAGAKSGDELGRLAAGMISGSSDWAAGYDVAALSPLADRDK